MRLRLALAILAAGSAAGCGSPHADFAYVETVMPPPDFPDAASPYQQELLADGVTAEEYETAIMATVDCYRAAGFTVSEPSRSPSGRYLEYSVLMTFPEGMDPFRDDPEVAEFRAERTAAAAACLNDYSDDVSRAWGLATNPSGDDLTKALADATDCLDELGVDSSSVMSRESLFELERSLYTSPTAPAEAGTCFAIYGDATRMAP